LCVMMMKCAINLFLFLLRQIKFNDCDHVINAFDPYHLSFVLVSNYFNEGFER
jgi:hypothetical protein